MLRRAFVLLGVAVLLSLLFPVKAVLVQSGVDPLSLRLPGVDLAGLCAALAVLPSMALCRDAQLGERIPRWNAWIALLALCSVLFVLLHVDATRELAAAYVRDGLASAGSLPVRISAARVMDAAELATRLGVLVCAVGVLVNLHRVPDGDAAPVKRRKP